MSLRMQSPNIPASEVDCSPEQVHQLVHCIIQEDILFELAKSIRLLPFEARKDAQIIFSHILRYKTSPTPGASQSGSQDPTAISYLVLQRPEIIVELCRGYDYPQSAMPCGTILRQALAHDTIAAVILYDESRPGEKAVQLKDVDVSRPQTGNGVFWKFFNWINQGSFEVSADAFTTFRVSPRRNPESYLAPEAYVSAPGNPYQTQTTRLAIPRHKLRPILHPTLQPDPPPLPLLRHKTPIHKTPWRTPARPLQLHHHDPIRLLGRPPQTHHDAVERRPQNGAV